MFWIMVLQTSSTAAMLMRAYGLVANVAAVVLGTAAVLVTCDPDEYRLRSTRHRFLTPATRTEMATFHSSRLTIYHDPEVLDFIIPSCDTHVRSDGRSLLALGILCILNSALSVEDGRAKWMEFTVGIRQGTVRTIESGTIVRPTKLTLLICRIIRWIIFFTLLQMFLSYSHIGNVIAIAWFGPPMFWVLILISFYG